MFEIGNSIEISGLIQNLAEMATPVTIMILSPNGSLVDMEQIMPDSEGNYEWIVKTSAAGTMKSNGEYEVRAQYGSHKITTVFDLTSN